jgi:hypothetical protein
MGRDIRDKFIDDRWSHWQTMMDAPRPKSLGQKCEGNHGGSWDWWTWGSSGGRDKPAKDFDDERAYCGSCGKMIKGVPSPWAEKALQDWNETSEHQRREYARHLESQKRKIKSGSAYGSVTWFGQRKEP